MEAKFKDVEFARKAYTKVVKRIVDAGVRFTPLFSLFLAFGGGPWRNQAHPVVCHRVTEQFI